MKSVVILLLLAFGGWAQPQRPVDEFQSAAGPIRITIINHASLIVAGGGQVIVVDPVGADRYASLPKGNLVLVTHSHGDHLDPAAIARASAPGAVSVGPESVAKTVPGMSVMRNGETRQAGPWTIEAVPAYNLTRGPAPGSFFHPKGDGNGYVLTLSDKRFYIAGDTENIPEMADLKNIEAAFLPMNLPYTMTPEEAAAAARAFKPKYVYPYHSRGTDLAAFSRALDGSGIEVRLRDWYQPGDDATPGGRGGGRGGAGARGGQGGRGGQDGAGAPQGAAAGRGQAGRGGRRGPAVVSPEVLGDRRVVFRLAAPRASEVTLRGDWGTEQTHSDKLVKDAQGVWSVTIGPLPPDVYSYSLVMDGINLADPVNGWVKPGVSTTQNMFEVPGPEAAFLQERDVPHGDVRVIYYQSASLGRMRRMHIYFPPGYETSRTRYPVMYLFHGGGDLDDGWTAIGRANYILDNLIADGKAKPMIIVMPDCFPVRPGSQPPPGKDNAQMLADDLFQDIIPLVDKNYRTLADRENRAIGGLSVFPMLPNASFPHLDKFAYIGHTANGMTADRLAEFEKSHPGLLEDPVMAKRVKIWMGDGVNASSYGGTKNFAGWLKSHNYNVTFYETNGIHGWPWFRRYLHEFAQVAFR